MPEIFPFTSRGTQLSTFKPRQNKGNCTTEFLNQIEANQLKIKNYDQTFKQTEINTL